MNEDREPYTVGHVPFVRHTTFGVLPIGARFLFQHRDSNSPNPWTKTGPDSYDNMFDTLPIPPEVQVTWLTDTEIETERQSRDNDTSLAARMRGVITELRRRAEQLKMIESKTIGGTSSFQTSLIAEANGFMQSADLIERAMSQENQP